jgi:hypothetical protein
MSEHSIECIVLGFLIKNELIEVTPQAHADLPVSLTSNAVAWVLSDQEAAGAYYLTMPTDPHQSSAVEYINDRWYYLTQANGKYYTAPCAQILAPFSLGLGTNHTPSAASLHLFREVTETTSTSGGVKSPENVKLEQDHLSQNRKSTRQLRDPFAFGFNDKVTLLDMMATITLQDTAVSPELAHREDIEMYHTMFCLGMGGRQSGDDGEGFVPGGSGPPSGPPGQSYPRGGPYTGLPGGLPRGLPGGGGGLLMGGGGNQNAGSPLQVGP